MEQTKDIALVNNLPDALIIAGPELARNAGEAFLKIARHGEVTAETYDLIVADMRNADDAIKLVEGERRNITRQIDELKRQLIERERQFIDPLREQVSRVKSLLLSWQKEQERIRQEAIRKAEEERRQAEIARQQAQRQEEEDDIFGDDPVFSAPIPVQSEVYVPPPAKKAVVERVTNEPVLADEEVLLAHLMKNGGKVGGKMLIKVDWQAVKKLAKAGIEFPGVEVQSKSSLAKGR